MAVGGLSSILARPSHLLSVALPVCGISCAALFFLLRYSRYSIDETMRAIPKDGQRHRAANLRMSLPDVPANERSTAMLVASNCTPVE